MEQQLGLIYICKDWNARQTANPFIFQPGSFGNLSLCSLNRVRENGVIKKWIERN